MFAAGPDLGAQQASNLGLRFSNGQSFLTWREVVSASPPERYRVYTAATPIRTTSDLARATLVATVARGSYWNARAGKPFVLTPLGSPLTAGDAFLVRTPARARLSYYCVTAVLKGIETKTVNARVGGNSGGPLFETPAPTRGVLQGVSNRGNDRHFVHFLPNVSTSHGKAQTNREGRALNYRLLYDARRSGPRPVNVFLHPRNGNYLTATLSGWVEPNAVQVFLDDDNPPARQNHSLWFGYHEAFGSGPPSGRVFDYTEQRILWTVDQVLGDPAIQADKNRVYCFGVSLGAMGSLAMGVRYPDRFAAVGGVVPAFGLRHKDQQLRADTDELFGTVAQNLPTNLGQKVYDLFDYATQVGLVEARGAAPMFFTSGRGDVVTGWSEKPAFFRAARRARHSCAFYWDFRAHAGTGPWSSLERALFREIGQIRLDRPLPALTNLTLDDDPGNGNRLNGVVTGTIGGYATFDPLTAAESQSLVRVDIKLKNDASRLDYAKSPRARVDITWRRLRAFAVKAGQFYRVQVRARGKTTLLEERFVTPDAKGLLTCRSVMVGRSYRTVDLAPYTFTSPETQLVGSATPGGRLAVTILGTKAATTLVFLGTRSATIATPFGVFGILDPIVVHAGTLPSNGLLELPIELPNDPKLGGVTILAQSLVSLKLTNTSRATVR